MARGQGKISDNELNSSLTNELDSKALQSSLDNLAGVGRTTETVKGVSDTVALHQADYAYQTPTIVGTEIQLIRESDTKRLYFYLSADLSGGNITISLDAGATSVPLKDIDGVQLIELSKGFVEVVDNTTFFTYAPKGAKINGLIKQYVVETGNTISAGDFVKYVNGKVANTDLLSNQPQSDSISRTVFETGSTASVPMVACQISENKVLVAYRDSGNNFYGTAVVLTISGLSISAGSPFVFESATITQLSGTVIDTDKALLVYNDNGNSYYGTAVVLTVSDTTISKGNYLVFKTADVSKTTITQISTNNACVVYAVSGLTALKILSVSGTDVSDGAEYEFINSAITDMSIALIDTDKVLLCFRNVSPYYCFSNVFTISGTTITGEGAEDYGITAAATNNIKVVTLETNKAVVTYLATNGYGVVVSVSDMTISKGTAKQLTTAGMGNTALTKLDEYSVGMVFSYATNPTSGKSLVLKITDTTITNGYEASLSNAGVASMTSVTTIDKNRMLVAFADDDNSSQGTAEIYTVPFNIHGVAKTAGTATETINVCTL